MKLDLIAGKCGLASLCLWFTTVSGGDPAFTIYTQNFAVIRETLRLDLKSGNDTVCVSGVTTQAEPDSVILSRPRRQTSRAGAWMSWMISEASAPHHSVDSKAVTLQPNEEKTLTYTAHHTW